MSLPTVIGAYNDCIDYFAKALDATKGIRIEFKDYAAARMFAMRMNQARVLLRDETRRVYPKESPLWNTSEYDCLQVRLPIAGQEDNWWVYIERHNASVLAVEEI